MRITNGILHRAAEQYTIDTQDGYDCGRDSTLTFTWYIFSPGPNEGQGKETYLQGTDLTD